MGYRWNLILKAILWSDSNIFFLFRKSQSFSLGFQTSPNPLETETRRHVFWPENHLEELRRRDLRGRRSGGLGVTDDQAHDRRRLRR